MAETAKAPTKARSRKSAAPAKAAPTAATIFEGARSALASAMKEAGVPEDVITRETTVLAEKCGMDMPYLIYEAPTPYGGATSFGEVDTYQEAVELDMRIAEITSQFQAIVDNVMGNEALSMEEKSDLIAAASADMKRRVQNPPMETGEAEAPVVTGQRVGSTAAKGTSFKAFKEGDTWHWFAVYSNTGVDKAKEWFGEPAHKEFIDYVWQAPDVRMPELWDWHTPVGVATFTDGRKGMGRADFVDFADGLAIASGHFYPEFNYAAEALSAEKELGVSHGYEYETDWLKPSGEYVAYRTFEISPLPRSRAANELTLFMPELAEKESPMFNPTRRPHLVAIHGEAKVKAMEDALAPAAAALKASGKEVSFKDLEDALAAATPEAGTAAAPASVPAVNAAAPALATEASKDAIAIVQGIKEGLTPVFAEIQSRLAALETKSAPDPQAIAAAAIKEAFGPRVTPAPGASPSESPDNTLHGNSKEVAAARQGGKEAGQPLPGVPDHLQWYIQQGGALLGSFNMGGGDDGGAAAVAAASMGATAGVS